MIKIEPPSFSEVKDISNINELKGKSGIYMLLDKFGDLLYIGQSINLFDRVRVHLRGRTFENRFVVFFRYFEVDNATALDIYEVYLINELQPPFNKSKTYTYNSLRKKKDYEEKMAKAR